MELLFETRPEIVRVDGQLYFFQCKPKIYPQPVVIGDTPTDGHGASCGTVLHDGGQYRMWYTGWPEDWTVNDADSALVGYAESDDGIRWRKPTLNRVEYNGSKKNNLIMGAPAVFVDPTAAGSHRYRATGCIDSQYKNHFPVPNPPREGGYYTFHSADGIEWEADSPDPQWLWADSISSIWHPGRKQGEVLMKRMPFMGGIGRRSFWNATLKGGVWSDWKMALVPDDYDDVIARNSGHVSADYYGVAMMPAGSAMVGFVDQFRHRHPLRSSKLHGGVYGNWGEIDVTLAYQSEAGAQWLHPTGRPDFLTHGEVPWARNGWFVGSNVVDCGSEQRLYLTGSLTGHMEARPDDKAFCSIGFVSWPKWRLFEFRAEPKGEMEIDLGVLKQPVELILNYKAYSVGSVRAQISSAIPLYTLEAVEGRGKADCVPLVGDKLGEVVHWKSGPVIQPFAGRHTIVRLFIEHASIYAYEMRLAK